ncbi:hypothetical protein [Mycobacterium deserti]|uniref:Uncharacterized protein n=1 Tax=Mycobacterium deserti TaxID=2978347 RepID=A0ABT2M3K5_9MYCO|nr:hypothetical protein [Mycobacterium deserti]MCT7656843.1 hypothetical protein [Mycobacterium deserti]
MGNPPFGPTGLVLGGGGLQLPSHDESFTHVPLTHLYFAQLVPLVTVWKPPSLVVAPFQVQDALGVL